MRIRVTKHMLVVPLMLVVIASPALISAPKRASPAELTLKDLEGKTVRLRDYRGKVVVLNFWATWCGPCKDEMPMLVDVEKKWAGRGVIFAGASLDDKTTRNTIPDFLKKFQVDFPVWVGANGDDLARLGMGEAIPATAFLDETGMVFARVQGEIKREELEERLGWVTGDRSRPAPQPLLRNL